MIKKHFRPLFYITILLFLACIVTIRNLGFTKYFIGEDSGLSLTFPDRLFESVYYMWDSITAPGKMNITSTFGFFWSNLVLFLFNLGFTDIHIKRIMYAIFFFVSGSSMFFLLSVILRVYTAKIQKHILYFSIFTGSLLYMFNPFTMQMGNLPIIPYHASYMILPLVFGLFIYNLQIRSSLLLTLLFSLSAFFLVGANPSNTISIGIFFMFYAVFFLREVKSNSKQNVSFIVASFIFILLLTSYICLPVLFSSTNPYGDVPSKEEFLLSLDVNSILTSFVNLLRLMGGPTWSSFSFSPQYTQNPILIIVSFIIPLFIFTSFMFTKYKKIKLFFLFVVVISLFFSKGACPPFENIFIFLYKSIPFFGIFRAVYYKFAFFAVLAYAVLLCFATIHFYEYFKQNFKKLLWIFIFIPLVIFIYGWPFFAGIITKQDYLTEIPDDYKQLKSIIHSDTTDSKVLALPPAPKGAGLLLQWENYNKYVGPHPDSSLIGKPVLDSYWFIRNSYKNLTVDDSWIGTRFEDNFNEVLRYLGILNVRYLLVHYDFIERYDFGGGDIRKIDGKLKAKRLDSIIAEQPEIQLIKKTPYYALYKIPDRLFLSHLYIPERIIYSDRQFETLFNNKNADQKKGRYAILPAGQAIHGINADMKYTPPAVSFKQINPTKYRAKIEQASKPFYLVFSESFDKNWKLYINKTLVEEKNHMMANGYANAWKIDVNQDDNDLTAFDLTIEYYPQKLFSIGLFVFKITVIGCLGYIIFNILRKKAI